MAFRPYFRSGIDELQQAAENARTDLNKLKVIQYELRHRERPKARALEKKVNEWIRLLIAGGAESITSSSSAFTSKPATKPSASFNTPEPSLVTAPNRVVVECIHCKNPNFVSTIENTVQHLHCFTCKAPFTAEFKNGVLRTQFLPIQPQRLTAGFSGKYLAFALAVLILIIILVK